MCGWVCWVFLVAMKLFVENLLWPCFFQIRSRAPQKRSYSRMCQSHSRRARVPVWCWGAVVCTQHLIMQCELWTTRNETKREQKDRQTCTWQQGIFLVWIVFNKNLLPRHSWWFPLLQDPVLIAVALCGAFALRAKIFFCFWARWTPTKRWTADPTAGWKSWGRGWGLVPIWCGGNVSNIPRFNPHSTSNAWHTLQTLNLEFLPKRSSTSVQGQCQENQADWNSSFRRPTFRVWSWDGWWGWLTIWRRFS